MLFSDKPMMCYLLTLYGFDMLAVVADTVAQTCTEPNEAATGMQHAAENSQRTGVDTDTSIEPSAQRNPTIRPSARNEAAADQAACPQNNPRLRTFTQLTAPLATGSNQSVPSISDDGYSTNHSTNSLSASNNTGTRAKKAPIHTRVSSMGSSADDQSALPSQTMLVEVDGKWKYEHGKPVLKLREAVAKVL